ncbi:TetR/AcrR family transcriptional regulator [Paenibacillus sp. GCM10023248]|uniref:TetR/AcrR family transcriptional regulator n=1 Tax=Bacillales TaxID=1385 RepID=UPI002379145A|nr:MULTISPECIES: TetR/AcrR family transcriptional regulator [Bacillales]MDD9267154.1 TetR/AcrR family transcriptional regulator [Paenibacillus sp. MAHUQ-63]MDR6881376.1 AcrR family transcriptional regulator [Bacillus sp. 3255]
MAKEDRKQQLIDAAVTVFAKQGFHKTTTAHIAQAVGVTQPYVFHFFKTKEELFIEVLQQSIQRIAGKFREVEAPAEQLADRMGAAFYQLLGTHRDETLLSMQAFTTAEPLIRQQVQEGFAHIHQVVKEKFELADIPQPGFQASSFIGLGLVAVMSEVLELPELSPNCENE